jgi:5'-phosphate synthase pdxT subunit
MKIGVLALQGAFCEHVQKVQALGAETQEVRLPRDLEALDALIIPGGESTTIGKLAQDYALMDPLRQFAQSKPTWGTCAGMIFLAKHINNSTQPTLGLMNIHVGRNAFGRQIDSFETRLQLRGIDGPPVPAVFIRAPVITQVGEGVDVLGTLEDGRVVAVQEGHLLATAFHPELTADTRLHAYFLGLIQGLKSGG